MSQPTDVEAPSPHRVRRLLLRVALYLFVLGLSAVILTPAARRFYAGYQAYRESQREAEDSVPIGYVGVSLRRSYHDRPTKFLTEREGRKLLWAAKGADGQPEYYDVTDAEFPVGSVSGGFGRDS